MTSRQSVAARGLLDWTQAELAAKAQIGVNTLKLFENGKANTTPVIINAIKRTLEDEGVEFINTDKGVGVLLAANVQ